MARRAIGLLTDGESIDEVYLVTDKQLRANRQGGLYLQVELRDRTGGVSARMWNANEGHFRSFEEGDFLKIKGKVQLYQGSLQILFSQFERVGQELVALEEFLPRTDKDVGKLLEKLRAILTRVDNQHLRGLVEAFLMDGDFVREFCLAPAGVRNHHAYLGGLLEHVGRMLEAADRLAPLYPELNRDLLLLGVFLHDIGKVRELSYQRVFGYTDEGQLIGHLVIGVEMLTHKARQAEELTGEPFPAELLLQLKHLILSHHGTHEFGSPRLPMTTEAIALHHLDNLDAKVHSFARDIKDDKNGTSAWTPYSPALGRRLFKGFREGTDPVTDREPTM